MEDAIDREIVGALIGGRYRVTTLLGAGGMGRVYAAQQEPLERKVALKILGAARTPELEQRFLREARLLSRISGPNIVAVFDYGTTDDRLPYLALEFLDGVTLRHELERGPVPLARAIAILEQVCAALGAAHRAGVAHLDLKPENVMLVPGVDGEVVKVLDFGIANIVGGAPDDARITSTGQVLGTPAYLSPEQIRGVRDDVRSDLYALGVIAYELVTGKMPFESSGKLDVIVHTLSKEPPPFAERAPGVHAPAALEAWVRRLLAKEPAERPADGTQALASLRACFATSAQSTETDLARTPAVVAPAATSVTSPVSTVAPTLVAADVVAPPKRRARIVAAALAIVVGIAVVVVAATSLGRTHAAASATLVVFPGDSKKESADAASRVSSHLASDVPRIVHVPSLRWQDSTLVLVRAGVDVTSDAGRDYTSLCRNLAKIGVDNVLEVTAFDAGDGHSDLRVDYLWLDVKDADVIFSGTINAHDDSAASLKLADELFAKLSGASKEEHPR